MRRRSVSGIEEQRSSRQALLQASVPAGKRSSCAVHPNVVHTSVTLKSFCTTAEDVP
jgi:hypothetical protein